MQPGENFVVNSPLVVVTSLFYEMTLAMELLLRLLTRKHSRQKQGFRQAQCEPRPDFWKESRNRIVPATHCRKKGLLAHQDIPLRH
mgnify:FL=1